MTHGRIRKAPAVDTTSADIARPDGYARCGDDLSHLQQAITTVLCWCIVCGGPGDPPGDVRSLQARLLRSVAVPRVHRYQNDLHYNGTEGPSTRIHWKLGRRLKYCIAT